MSNALDFTKIDPDKFVVREYAGAWAIGYWYPETGAKRVWIRMAFCLTEVQADWLLEAIREKLETRERELQQYRKSSSRCINVPLPSGDLEAIREKLRSRCEHQFAGGAFGGMQVCVECGDVKPERTDYKHNAKVSCEACGKLNCTESHLG
jgi:hypothetical protein